MDRGRICGLRLATFTLWLVAALLCSSSVADAAGFSYTGGASSGTNLPISSLKILTSLPVSSGAYTVTIPAPKTPTPSNPARVTIRVRIQRGTFAKGDTLVIASPPTSLPPLYYLNGATTFSATLAPSRPHVEPVSPGIEAAAVSVQFLASVYIGVYVGRKELTKKYSHPITVSLIAKSISGADTLFESNGLKWANATGDKFTKGTVKINLSTNHALQLVHVVRGLMSVTFVDNGGTGVVRSVAVSKGSRVDLPSQGVTRAGYRLDGWSLTGRAPVLKSPYRVSKNVILYAVWSRLVVGKARITLVADGGSGSLAPLHALVGTTITLPSGKTLVRHGYYFVGWSRSGHSPVLLSRYLVSASVTLKAVWARGVPVIDTVTFVDNGGHGTIALQRVDQGERVLLPTQGVNRLGYHLVGWSLTGHAPVVRNVYLVTHSVILLAVWKVASTANYSVEFLINGGEGTVQNAEGPIGTLVTLPSGAGLTRSGYRFGGWSVTGLAPALAGPLVIEGNITLRAIWVK